MLRRLGIPLHLVHIQYTACDVYMVETGSYIGFCRT